MAAFARIPLTGEPTLLEVVYSPIRPDDLPHKVWRWVPLLTADDPFDPITQTLSSITYELVGDALYATRRAQPKTANEITAMQITKIKAIKAEAQRRIVVLSGGSAGDLISSVVKQLNSLARSIELLNKGKGQWSGAEQTEATSLETLWAQIKAVRLASDEAEADLLALGLDPMAIHAFSATGW